MEREVRVEFRTKAVAVAIAAFLLIAGLGTSRLIADANSARTISLHNIHTKDTITVIYKKRGRYIPSAMKKINWVLRDWRRDEPTKMDPKLIDILWEMHTELGSQKPIHVISGYRSSKTNNMLRKTRGGQAKRSRHILGKAADVHFPDVPIKRLRYSALIRQRGGVGYYPTSAIPFVHVDTGRVRHWPRMGRQELALLFPSGRTKHRPRRGGPITRSDHWKARRKNRKLAQQIAEFREFRKRPKSTTAIAAAAPLPAKRREPRIALARQPALAKRPARSEKRRQQVAAYTPPPPSNRPVPALETKSGLTNGPSEQDRSSLFDLFTLAAFMPEPKLVAQPALASRAGRGGGRIQQASLGGSFVESEILPWLKSTRDKKPEPLTTAMLTGEVVETNTDTPSRDPGDNDADRMSYAGQWAPAPAYDEEHPDELSYRPFPLAPLLTASSSPDDPILAQKMVAPDPEATLTLLTDDGTTNQMHFVPGRQAAALLWATQFSGDAVNLRALQQKARDDDALQRAKARGLSSRSVKTSMR